MRNPKTTHVAGAVTATLLSVVTLTSPFAVLAAQEGQAIRPTPLVTGTTPSSPIPIPTTADGPAISVVLTNGALPPQAITTHSETVADALVEAGITLSPTDHVRPALSTPTTSNMHITVTRIRMALENQDLPIPCGTVFRMSAAVVPGHVQPGRVGASGLLTRTFLVRYVNGRSASRKLVKSTITRRPVPAETLAGIRVREARALPSRAGTYNRMRMLSMTATGYSPYEGSAVGLCKNGMRAGYGIVAVDPRLIRLGSRLYVEGYGYAVAGDTGGAIKGHRIDLGHTTRREAMDVGRRHVTVWLLNPSR